MTSLRDAVKRFFLHVKPLPAGIYHFQSPPTTPSPYRLHLRVEPDGNGLLIINASTILHLNPTATEYAYHIVKKSPAEVVVHQISSRYRVSKTRVLHDFQELMDRIQTLIETPDLDPEMYLDFARMAPASSALSAPYRIDCALTYRLPSGIDPAFAPMARAKRELSTLEWLGILDKAWSAGIPHVVFTGGEPTLRDDLPDLLIHAEENGQVTGLLTDGLIFNRPEKLSRLLQTGLDHVMLMLAADQPEAWNALSCLKKADIYVSVHQTLTLHNVLEVGDTIRKLSQYDINSLSLTTNDVSLQNSLIDLRNLAASMNISLTWDLPVPYSAFNPVSIEIQEDTSTQENYPTSLYIEPDGDVLPAQGVELVLGNLLTDPWDKIWR